MELGQVPHLCEVCEDTEDGEGWRRDFRAVLADIRAAFGSAHIVQAEFAQGHESILWHDGGDLLPGEGPTAVGLWREYWRDHHTILLYQNGQLYNLYLKRRGSLKRLSSSSSSSSVPAAPAPAAARAPTQLWNILEPDVQDVGGTAVGTDADRSSGEPRPAEQS